MIPILITLLAECYWLTPNEPVRKFLWQTVKCCTLGDRSLRQTCPICTGISGHQKRINQSKAARSYPLFLKMVSFVSPKLETRPKKYPIWASWMQVHSGANDNVQLMNMGEGNATCLSTSECHLVELVWFPCERLSEWVTHYSVSFPLVDTSFSLSLWS